MSYGPPYRGPPRNGREHDYVRGGAHMDRRRSPSYGAFDGGPVPQERPPSPPYRYFSPPPGARPASPWRYGRSRSPIRRHRSPSPYRNAGDRYPPGGPSAPGPFMDDFPMRRPYVDGPTDRAGPLPRDIDLPPRPFHPYRARYSPSPPGRRPSSPSYAPYRNRSPDRDGDWNRRPRSPSPRPFPNYRGRSRSRDGSYYQAPEGQFRSRSPGIPPGVDPGHHPGRSMSHPDSEEHLLPFAAWTRWFSEFQPEIAKEEEINHPGAKLEDQPVVGLPYHYNKYKESFKARQLWTLYLVHRDQGWFKDRYSNEENFVNMRIENVKRGKVDTVRKYIVDLGQGQWDDINYEASKACEGKTLPNGMAICGPGIPQSQDPDVIEIEQPAKQLFIKTVHSNHSRSSLEEAFRRVAGYQYLALSDPSPKKQYTRVGWIQFKQTANMDSAHSALDRIKVGGFQLNMVKNSEPFIGRARFTPSLSCTLERMQHDAQQAKAMAQKLESDLFTTSVQEPTPVVDEGVTVAMKEEPEDGEVTMQAAASGVKSGENQLEEGASGHVEARIAYLWEKQGLNKPETELSSTEATEKARIELDHWLSYLRNALHTCYYCVAPTDYAEELYRKCIRHLRSPIPEEKFDAADDKDVVMADVENGRKYGRNGAKRKAHDRTSRADVWAEKRWSDNVDHKIKLVILPRDKIDLENYGAKQKEDYPPYKRIIDMHISVDDPKKSRCTLCNKPFKAAEFVARHVVSRHPEIANDLPNPAEFEERLNKDYPMYNNFALDPQHLPPTSNYPASVFEEQPRLSAEHLPTSRDAIRRPEHHHQRHDDPGRGRPLHSRLGGFAMGGLDDNARPPVKVKEDPRAKRGRISYVDLDASAGKAAPEPVAETGGLPW